MAEEIGGDVGPMESATSSGCVDTFEVRGPLAYVNQSKEWYPWRTTG
jgi:hypothetical protein